MTNGAFKYRIVFEHDGYSEEFFALTEEDAHQIKKALFLACESGVYKNCKVEIHKL